MNNTTLTETFSKDGKIRLLVDLVRDNLAKQSNKDYETISHSIKFLTGEEIEPEELKRFDEIFRMRQLLNKHYSKLPDSLDNLRFMQVKKKETLWERFLEEQIKEKLKGK